MSVVPEESPRAGTPVAETELLRRRVARERAARVEAERIAEESTARLSEANRELEAFVSNAAHDLRTPVVALQGFADVLASMVEDPSEDLRTILDRIRVNGEFMGAVLTDLLEFSAATHAPVGGVTEDVGAVVDAVLADLAQRYEAPRVRVEPVPAVAVAPADLRRALSNLIGNALAYGGPEVEVSLSARHERGGVVVVVADDGPGIPEADRARIFEPFVRGANRDRSTGTGLGLAISRRIARRAGGDLQLVSSPRGAVFELRLPAHPQD